MCTHTQRERETETATEHDIGQVVCKSNKALTPNTWLHVFTKGCIASSTRLLHTSDTGHALTMVGASVGARVGACG